MKEAYLYEKLENEKVRCHLCNHNCLIKGGARGICGVRENRVGTLISLVYGKVIARHCDPHCKALRPYRKKTPFPFFAGQPFLFHSNCGLQFQMPFLPECGYLPNAV